MEARASLIPRWALMAAVLMLLLGVILGATREGRERRAAVAMLNDASVEVSEQSDGFHEAFGLVFLNNKEREFTALLGDCERRPRLAWEVFREVLERGTSGGRILACSMAFFLAQKDCLTRDDLELIAKQLSGETGPPQRAAQRTLSNLLLLRDQAKAKTYEEFPAPPEAKERLSAKTKPVTRTDGPEGSTWLSVSWSSPAACRAWWRAFGPKAAWDPKLRLFVLADGP